MPRIIDCEAFDRELQNLIGEYNRNCESDKSEGAFEALRRLRLSPSIDTVETTTAFHWISVDDVLPETGGMYLVYMPGRAVAKVISARYNSQSGRWLGAEALCYFEGITHWMPLPAPPDDPI